MMKNEAAGSLTCRWGACDHNNRRAFGIGACDGVNQVEGAGPERDDGDTQTSVIARRRIGGKADSGLVAQRVMWKNPALLDDLEKGQHEIARNPKDFASAVVLQAV